jgi:hypothetical protein
MVVDDFNLVCVALASGIDLPGTGKSVSIFAVCRFACRPKGTKRVRQNRDFMKHFKLI